MTYWTRLACYPSAAIVIACALSPAAAQEATVKLDMVGKGPAISPLIHGQFIEHLGRCIYGGIWAEMLRDRKFLQPPGQAWQVVNPDPDAFQAMLDPAGAYAGDHCMALWVKQPGDAPHGIHQAGLGLVRGKQYVGYAVLAHLGDQVPVTIRLSWGPGPSDSQTVTIDGVGRTYRRHEFTFTAGATTDAGALEVLLDRPAYLWIGCLSLMPADNVEGMRPDTLALIRQIAPPIVRWPGGNFVSGYRWQDGIGPRDRRPPRFERAWNDVEPNDFGVDEFMAFCRLVGTEPYICVNAGLGTAEDAANLVRYCNASAPAEWGKKRAANGHRAPYKVKWWGIGNEMYGDWQLGHVPVEQYALRHNAFARAMREADPSIHIVAVGAPGEWDRVLLDTSVDHMDLLSGHFYQERRFRVPMSEDNARAYTDGFAAYSGGVAAGIRGLVQPFRDWVASGARGTDRVKLAIDEWGIVRDWNKTPDGYGIGSFEFYYTLGDAIDVARGLNELLRSADVVQMANWAQTVNVIGAIKTSRTAAVMDPVGHVMALYRRYMNGRLVPVSLTGGEHLDVVAARSDDGKTLSVALVNWGGDAASARLDMGGFGDVGRAVLHTVSGPSLTATNVPGKPEQVTVTETQVASLSQPVQIPPYTVSVLTAGLH